MGLYDREYSREEDEWSPREYGDRSSNAHSMVLVLIAVNVAVFILDRLLHPNFQLMSTLAIYPESLVKPWMWWQFLTACFAHSPDNFNHILWNMFALFVFGRDVEGKLGRFEFLRFYLIAGVLGNVLFAALRYAGVLDYGYGLGASGAVTAVTILYVCYFPRNTLLLFFVLPVPAWLVAVLLVGGDILGALNMHHQELRVGHDVHLTGAALAFGYWYFGWYFGSFMPLAWLAGAKRWFTQPRLKIHNPERSRANLDAEADRVLEKVHEHGEASLTPAERRTLEEYSRRMRQKLR